MNNPDFNKNKLSMQCKNMIEDMKKVTNISKEELLDKYNYLHSQSELLFDTIYENYNDSDIQRMISMLLNTLDDVKNYKISAKTGVEKMGNYRDKIYITDKLKNKNKKSKK